MHELVVREAEEMRKLLDKQTAVENAGSPKKKKQIRGPDGSNVITNYQDNPPESTHGAVSNPDELYKPSNFATKDDTSSQAKPEGIPARHYSADYTT